MKMRSFSTVLALSFAVGAAAPIPLLMPTANAADAPAAREINRGKVPPAALATMDRVVPAGAKKLTYHEQSRPSGKVYVANYFLDGQHLKFHVNPDGTVFGGIEANPGVDLSVLNPTAAPSVGTPVVGGAGLEQQRAQIVADQQARLGKIDELTTQIGQLDQQIAALDRQAPKNRNAANQRTQLTTQRAQLVTERERQTVEVARQEQRIRDIEAQLNPQLAAQMESPELQREEAPNARPGQWQYTKVSSSEVPTPAYLTMLKYTRNGHGQAYRKEVHDGKTSYGVFYYSPENKWMWMSVFPDGTIQFTPRLVSNQPGGGKPALTANTTSGAPAGGAGIVYHKTVEASLPQAVRKAMDAQTKGDRDLSYATFEKNGRNFYSVHYTSADGKRLIMHFDADGHRVEGPFPEPK